VNVSSGYVGIGTTSPSGLLHVQPATNFSATGGTITTDGEYTIHTFTENGTFTPSGSFDVEYLVVAGGGGGGGTTATGSGAGGGGAGGFRTTTGFAVTAQAYSITVGGGGSGGDNSGYTTGASGGNSVFSTITSTGGGGGSGGTTAGAAGGSGGGGGYNSAGGTGTAGQGNDGGTSNTASPYAASGGGGATAAGNGAAADDIGGAGGAGTVSTIYNGSNIPYAGGGGGGGGANFSANTGGAGGSGGGGQGGGYVSAVDPGDNATANTGGGGGGGAGDAGGAGGSGIVIIRYLTQGNFIVDSSGNVGIGTTSPASLLHVAGKATISTINLTGGQIAFPATAVPSSDPNTLDDYEEGTWTPALEGGTVAGDTTYTTQVGSYEKIGRQVNIRGRLAINLQGTLDGYVYVSNLPFTSNAGAETYGIIYVGYGASLSITAGCALLGYVEIDDTKALIQVWDLATGTSVLDDAELTDGAELIFAGQYMI